MVKLGKSSNETHKTIPYANQWHIQRYDRLKHFQNGQKMVDDDPHLGRLSTLTDDASVTKVNEIVRSNRRLTV